jgi:hypothetical protein
VSHGELEVWREGQDGGAKWRGRPKHECGEAKTREAQGADVLYLGLRVYICCLTTCMHQGVCLAAGLEESEMGRRVYWN